MLNLNLPKVNIERLKERGGRSNTEIACLLLGWQGGTVHQVAEETGLTVVQIIDSKDIEALVIKALLLQQKKNWHLKEADNFLNNSAFAMMQHEKDAQAIGKEIKELTL